MQRLFPSILLLCLFFALFACCKKKPDSANNNTPTFADSLRRSCIQPFTGPGDSSDYYLPTAFTPNGDGINDLYRIIGKNLNFSSFLMSIYDTTGTLVFQSKDASYSWNGKDTTTGKQSTKYKFYVEVAYTTTGNRSASAGTFLFLLATTTPPGCVNIVKSDSSSYEFGDQFSFTGFNAATPSGESFCI